MHVDGKLHSRSFKKTAFKFGVKWKTVSRICKQGHELNGAKQGPEVISKRSRDVYGRNIADMDGAQSALRKLLISKREACNTINEIVDAISTARNSYDS